MEISYHLKGATVLSDMKTVGQKHDTEKPRWDLLPLPAVSDIVDVLTFGAKKYGDHNWKHVSNAEDRYFAALMRHLVAYRRGIALDEESKLSHLAHAGCCLLFLSTLQKDKGPK